MYSTNVKILILIGKVIVKCHFVGNIACPGKMNIKRSSLTCFVNRGNKIARPG